MHTLDIGSFRGWRARWSIQIAPQLRDRVLDEQLRLVWSHARLGTLVATAFAVLLAMHLRGVEVPAIVVDVWLAIKLVVAGGRMLQGHFYVRRGDAGGLRWREATIGLLALDGAVWGIAGLTLMAGAIPLASLIGACMVSLACIATFGLQVSVLATAAYVVPIIAATALGLLLRGDDFGWLGGIGMLMLLGLQLATAMRSQHRIVDGVLLRLKAEALAVEKDEALKLALRQSAVKTQFLANISHELRTPLHGILGVSRLLHLEANDAAVARRVELIEASGTHLLGLINDLLDISRVESGRVMLNQQTFDLADLIDQVAGLYAVRCEDKGVAFDFSMTIARPQRVVGDPARLRQVLHNLLGNAVKFTRRGSISLRVSRDEPGNLVRFEVCDTGSGIAPGDLEHVFEAFRQLGDGLASPLEGAGLGLTIARELARAMGGDISAASVLGEGSTMSFTARLPHALPAPAPHPDRTAAAPEPSGKGWQVLVAEDDEVNAIIAVSYLEHFGFMVERVADGKEAVRHALREVNRPDLVLMDCRMPELDGYEAARKIRSQEQILGLARLPMIALTATAGDADRQQCLDAGMDDFLSKPYTREQLARTLSLWLETRPEAAPS